jgi:hypothetical protein
LEYPKTRPSDISIKIKKRTEKEFDLTQRFIPVLVIGILLSNSGAKFPLRPDTPIQSWINLKWISPPEIQMLSSISQSDPKLSKFARLGSNDDSGFGAFLPANWTMVCTRHGITGAEPLSSITKFVSCLKSEPDVVLISPAYVAQSNRPGSYQYYYKRTQEILNENFLCQDNSENSVFQVCKRIRNVPLRD